MANPKAQVPAWIHKGISTVQLNRATISIDSVRAVGTNVKGAAFSNPLTYQKSLDRWLQGRFPLGGFAGTSQIEVHFTINNVGKLTFFGEVHGSIGTIGAIATSTALIPNVSPNDTFSSFVTFHPLNDGGDHALTLTFRQPFPSPTGIPLGVNLASASTDYFVY